MQPFLKDQANILRLANALRRTRVPPSENGLFVVFEGIDGAGKTSAASALCARLAAGSVDFVVANKLNHSFRDPLLSEAADYAGRIVLHCSARSVLPVPRAVAAADALRFTLLYEGAVRPALERGQLVLADAWSYKRILKNAVELSRSVDGEDYVDWLGTLFGPSVAEDVCLLFDLPVAVAASRKTGMMTRSELGPGADDSAEEAGFTTYQVTLRRQLRQLAEVLNWTEISISPDASPDEVAALALDVITAEARFTSCVRRH